MMFLHWSLTIIMLFFEVEYTPVSCVNTPRVLVCCVQGEISYYTPLTGILVHARQTKYNRKTAEKP